MKAPEKAWLTAYALGELHEPRQKRMVEEWLAVHPEALEEQDAISSLGLSLEDAFRNEPVACCIKPMPEMDLIPEEEQKALAGYPRFIWGLGLAACLLMAFGIVFIWQQEDEATMLANHSDSREYRRVDTLASSIAGTADEDSFSGLSDWPRIGFRQTGETLLALEDFLENAHIPSFSGRLLGDWLNFFGARKPVFHDQKEVIAVHMEHAKSPIDPGKQVVKMAVRARPSVWSARPPSNLVFVLDNSATMEGQGRLDLAKEAVDKLLDRLDDRDRVALICSEGDSALLLRSTGLSLDAMIRRELAGIEPVYQDGSVAVWDEAFRQARRYFVPHGNNQIIVLTDGGLFHESAKGMSLEEMQALCRERGIRVSAYGLGMVQHPQSLVSRMAGNGGGVFGFLDEEKQVTSVFVDRLCGALNPLAHDLKIQLVADGFVENAYEVLGSSLNVDYGVLAESDWVQSGDLWTGLLEVDDVDDNTDRGGDSAKSLKLRVAYQLDSEDGVRVLDYDVPLVDSGLESISPDFKFSLALAAFADWIDQGDQKSKQDLRAIVRCAEEALRGSNDAYEVSFLQSLKKLEERSE